VRVLGVDVWKGRWVAVILDQGRVAEVATDASFLALTRRFLDATIVAVDIPIGLPERGRRRADEMVRNFIGVRRSSVFFAPPRRVIEQATYGQALSLSRQRYGLGISAQAYALRAAVMESAGVADEDGRVFEVHPEASFREMAGEPLAYAKRTWNGQMMRRALLAEEGIDIPDDLGEAGLAAADDVLDAAAAAWSARRLALGEAFSLPDPPQRLGGRDVAIWC
jgi:predicted RNase H-like nuclease